MGRKMSKKMARNVLRITAEGRLEYLYHIRVVGPDGIDIYLDPEIKKLEEALEVMRNG